MRHVGRLALVILAGCGSGGGTSTPHDAPTGTPDMAKPIDGAVVDAPPDAAPDAPPDAVIVPGTAHHYVLDRVLLPSTNTEARNYGLDLNADTIVDNQLGMIIATLAAQGFDNQTDMDQAIDRGSVIMLGSVRATSLINAMPASFTIYQGTNPMPAPCSSPQDTICRKHLTGTGTFTIDTSVPADPPLVGSITNGTLTAGPGHLTIRFMFGGSNTITVTLLGARVELMPFGTSLMGKLAGAISQTDVQTKLIPPMRDGFEKTVMQQCTMLTSPPTCGCPAGSTGRTLLGLFDNNPQNCSISLAEVQNNSLIVSLFAPDVTVEGKQALSFGVAVTAVQGTFIEAM